MIMAATAVNFSVAGAEETNPPMDSELGLGDISQNPDVSYLQDTTISPVFVETQEQASDFTETPIDIPSGDQEVTLLYPMTIPQKGAVTLMLMQKDEVEFSSLTMELYSDVACTKKQGSFSLFSGEPYAGNEIFCPNAGTYYLKAVFNRKYGVTDEKHFVLESIFISNADRDLAEESLALAYSDYDNRDITYKVQVRKTGVLVFGVMPSDYTSSLTGYATLYNAKKKAISAKEYISNVDNTSSDAKYARAYYTLKKGTYYIKVSAVASTAHYIVGYSMVDAKDTSGASRAKAAKLTIGSKAKQGMVLASDSKKKTDWYKLTLTKKGNLQSLWMLM